MSHDACWCSDIQNYGGNNACPPGKCPNVPIDVLRSALQAAERERDSREPTQEDGDAADDGSGQVFVTGWTGHRCVDCNHWTWGGPTRCVPCVRNLEIARLREALEFYGAPETWEVQRYEHGGAAAIQNADGEWCAVPAMQDNGKRAREALGREKP